MNKASSKGRYGEKEGKPRIETQRPTILSDGNPKKKKKQPRPSKRHALEWRWERPPPPTVGRKTGRGKRREKPTSSSLTNRMEKRGGTVVGIRNLTRPKNGDKRRGGGRTEKKKKGGLSFNLLRGQTAGHGAVQAAKEKRWKKSSVIGGLKLARKTDERGGKSPGRRSHAGKPRHKPEQAEK